MRFVALIPLLLLGSVAGAAGREAVLKQVDLPHSYYWRELYIPQLTTGPSSAAFTPDGKTLVYSMAGSLWRQRIGSDEAFELTHPRAAYDYQPDVAPDGKSVIFARYDGAALELWRLDLVSGREQQLTSGNAVNVEPRLSPDGKRIAWVSTQGTGHFNLFIADIAPDGLRNARPLLGERQSKIPRYYYSTFDHALNPSWSPDGKRVLYLTNTEVAWGSGDIWSVAVDDPRERRKVWSEETSWSARPEMSPDGKRILFASYHGRQWRQLWLTTPGGAAPLPLTFGDFDLSNARWSPDGTRIAFVSNEQRQHEPRGPRIRRRRNDAGRTQAAALQAAASAPDPRHSRRARPQRARARGRHRQRWPGGRTERGLDARGRRLRSGAPADRDPLFPLSVAVHGGRARWRDQHLGATRFSLRAVEADGEPHGGQPDELAGDCCSSTISRASFGTWRSADLHVHMNYGGHYRNSPPNLVEQARAEDLDVVYNLIVNKEERIPDIAFAVGRDPASTGDVLLMHAQEFHTSYWGHLGLLNLSDHVLTPDFSAYQHTALASPYPHNGVIADLARAQGGLVGYVHPFDWLIDPATEKSLTNQLPADVANGKVDYVEVVGFADHKATAAIWYRLLNLGFRLPAGAGTDAMANYASLRGPVGMNRVFLEVAGDLTPEAVRKALKEGRTFATNGPLLGLEVGGERPGGTIRRKAPGTVRYRIALRSPVAVDHLELVQNGKVVKRFDLSGDRRSLDSEGELQIDTGGWLLLRASNDGADPQVLDLYPYATTSPIYLELPGDVPTARDDAAYFAAWMERVLRSAEARDDYNDAREREATLAYLRRALDRYHALAGVEGEAR